MSDVIDIARKTVDAFSSDDWDAYRAALAPGSVYHEFCTGRRVEGPDAVVEASRSWKQAFPDGSGTVTNALAMGNTAVLEVTWRGTQTEAMVTPTGQTLPPSGKYAEVAAVQVITVEDGKITENRHYFDLMTILAQIGALPAPASA